MHNRQNAKSLPVKLWKQTKKLHRHFWGFTENFRDSFFWRWMATGSTGIFYS